VRGPWPIHGFVEGEDEVARVEVLLDGLDLGQPTLTRRDDGRVAFALEWNTQTTNAGVRTLSLRVSTNSGRQYEEAHEVVVQRDYRLLRATGELTVHRVDEAGRRRAFPNADCFLDWGFDWHEVDDVAPEAVYGLPAEPPLPHLVRGPDWTVYWLDGISQAAADHYLLRWCSYVTTVEPRPLVVEGPLLSPQPLRAGQPARATVRLHNLALLAAVVDDLRLVFEGPNGETGEFTRSGPFRFESGAEHVYEGESPPLPSPGRYHCRLRSTIGSTVSSCPVASWLPEADTPSSFIVQP
jgi:hypothetical protein